ncbi:prepilin peptidase [Streptomyces sp. NPDC088253]|uniref:prepilin peptidase n=1 Tax=Streptomyces sp. NPDC088253 TaxID=3365846 RepID=UPI0037F59214
MRDSRSGTSAQCHPQYASDGDASKPGSRAAGVAAARTDAVLLATIDFAVHRLPDVVTLSLAASAFMLLGGAVLLLEAGGGWRIAPLGSLTLGAGYFVLFLIDPRGFGFGHVKFAPALGAVLGWYGWGILLIGTFAYFFGALYGGGLILARRAGRKSAIPFGPFLIAGAFAGYS